MAKPKVNLKKLQKDYEERLAKQRNNRNNWGGSIITPAREKDIASYEDFKYDNINYKKYKK